VKIYGAAAMEAAQEKKEHSCKEPPNTVSVAQP